MGKKFKRILSLLVASMLSMSLFPSIKADAVTKLGERLLVGYWHNFENTAGTMKLSEVSDEWDVINVSFGITEPNDRATIVFEPYYNEAEFIADVKKLQSKGKKVLLSLGGETGIVKVTDAAAKSRYVKSILDIVNKYGFDGIDIDLEGGSGISIGPGDSDFKNPTSPMLVNLIEGTREICNKFGSDFMLTMAPETMYVQGGFSAYGGTAGGYLPIIYGLREELTFIHVQDYNTGGMLGLDGQNYTSGNADFHVAMTEMLLQGFPIGANPNNVFPALRPDQVMFGVPASTGAAGSGYTSPKEMKKAVKYLMTGESYGGRYKLKNKSGYSDFRGLMTWSINWDKYNNYEFSKTYRKLLDGIVIPTYELKEATITNSSVKKGDYKLTASIPAKNSAVSYKILEGNLVIASGVLNKGEDTAKTITHDIKGKTEGNYIYTVVLTDKDGKIVTSKPLIVTVPKDGGDIEIPKSPLPDRIMVGYWHNFTNGAGVIELSEVSDDWDVINVSFGETFSDRAVVELHPVYDEDRFIQDIQNLQAKGKKVVLSLGGAEGTIKIPTEADRQKFMTSIVGLIETYGFDGIDIDLEGGSGMILQSGDTDFRNPTTPQIVNFIKSIKELDAMYGNDFIVSMAPELSYVQGGIISYANNWGAYLPLIHGVRDELDFLQVQHYNSGGNLCLDGNTYKEGSADFHVSMIDMLLQGFPIGGNQNNMFPPLRQDQVVIGIPSSTPSAGSGYTPPAEMKKALDYLIKGQSFGGQYKMRSESYPELRGMMTWSINWDLKYNSEFIKNYRPYFDALPTLNDSLKKATISASDVVNGNYDLTVTVPAKNTATSYKILEGTSVIDSGSLIASSKDAKVIKKSITNKTSGSYKYTVVLTDVKGESVISNELTVTVKDATEDQNKEDINKDGVVNNLDLELVSSKYNVAKGQKGYDVKLDLNKDNIIDLFDIVAVSNKMGETTPTPNPEPGADNYDPTYPYAAGDIVIYNGKKYQSQGGWVVGIIPGTHDGVWKPIN